MKSAKDITHELMQSSNGSSPARSVSKRLPRRNAAQAQEGGESLPARKGNLALAATEIKSSAPGPQDLAFLAKQFVQVTLPHRDPGDVPAWSRTNGFLTLTITRASQDSKTGKLVGYPYGTIPRLLLYWITKEALNTRSKILRLGPSLSDFLEEIGLSPATGGGKRSDAARLKEQMRRLFRASISFQYANLTEERFGRMNVAENYVLWWDPDKGDQNNLFDSYIELGEAFFKAITAAPVPLDVRALRALNHSPLALDLYGWCAYTAFIASRQKQPIVISFQDLQSQLGSDYEDNRDFRKKLVSALKQITQVYPDLKIALRRGGLTVFPSLPPIPAQVR